MRLTRWILLLLLLVVALSQARASKTRLECEVPQPLDMRGFVPMYHRYPTVWLDWLSAGRPMDGDSL